MEGKDHTALEDPMVKKLFELVGLWWAEAGRYGVLPLDDRLQERLLGREGLKTTRTKYTFHAGAARVPEAAAPETLNRSWAIDAHIDVPPNGADGPLVAMGGDTNGWALYLKGGTPSFVYNLAAVDVTYIRGANPLGPGRHVVRYEFEKRGKEPYGAGGIGRLFVDGKQVGEGEIKRTAAFGYSLDETFDIGCDKGAPVTDEYASLAAFTGTIVRVDVDLKPDFARDMKKHVEHQVQHAMMRE
jgi:arylsulfatase